LSNEAVYANCNLVHKSRLETISFWSAAAVIFLIAIFSRRPDVLTYPQFFAEDGSVWYQQAYNQGALQALLIPQVGYLQTLPRLVALGSLGLPFATAPLLFNLCGMLAQVAPALFLLSDRMRHLARFSYRTVFAVLLIAQPNVAELHVSITYAQWHLALLAFLVLVALPPERTSEKLFDCGVLTLCCASGPFCILLLPSAFLLWTLNKARWQSVRLGILAVGACVQGTSLLLSHHHARSHAPLGAAWQLLFRILAGQVVLPIFQGSNRLQHWAHSKNQVLIVAITLTASAAIVSLWAFWRGSAPLRAFLLFAGMVLASALLSPMGNLTSNQWEAISVPGAAGRYWYLPSLAIACVLFWMLSTGRPLIVRGLALLLLCSMSLASMRSWRYPAMTNLDFPHYASTFAALPPGAQFQIPINPSGWEMKLTKH